jgi:CRP-like cAMP-binding protein
MISIMSQSVGQIFEEAAVRRHDAGQQIFHSGDRVGFLHFVEAGRIDLVRQTRAGAPVILQRAGPGQVLAEASVYSATYHCDARTITNSVLRVLPVSAFRRSLETTPELAGIWAEYLAHSVQAARLRAEIRTLRTVAERLDAWLGGERALPEKGTWQDLAAELGVSREALYRELAKRR